MVMSEPQKDLTWKDYVIMSLMAFPVVVEYALIILIVVSRP